jgi:hypothetical protein
MQGAEFVERYRSYAAQCEQSWLKLAEQVAEAAETAIVYESAVPGAPQRD